MQYSSRIASRILTRIVEVWHSFPRFRFRCQRLAQRPCSGLNLSNICRAARSRRWAGSGSARWSLAPILDGSASSNSANEELVGEWFAHWRRLGSMGLVQLVPEPLRMRYPHEGDPALHTEEDTAIRQCVLHFLAWQRK